MEKKRENMGTEATCEKVNSRIIVLGNNVIFNLNLYSFLRFLFLFFFIFYMWWFIKLNLKRLSTPLRRIIFNQNNASKTKWIFLGKSDVGSRIENPKQTSMIAFPCLSLLMQIYFHSDLLLSLRRVFAAISASHSTSPTSISFLGGKKTVWGIFPLSSWLWHFPMQTEKQLRECFFGFDVYHIFF